MRYLPLGLFLAFVLADALANWRVIPGRTVSEYVWALGWVGRIITLLVFTHLFFKWPYGPPS